MFDFLKKTWQGATKRAREEEDKARASSPQSAAPGAGVVDMMPSMAGEFATKLASRGLTLDFTPASLPSVDRVLASATKELAAMPDDDRKKGQESHTCLKIAAYVGEVLRREEGGLWATGPDGLPLLDLGAHHAPVVTAVFALMTDGWIGMPDGPVDTVVAYYDHVSLEARGRLDGIVRGTHPSLESLQQYLHGYSGGLDRNGSVGIHVHGRGRGLAIRLRYERTYPRRAHRHHHGGGETGARGKKSHG